MVMCGLPGAGKSTLADAVGTRLGWPVLAVDPVELAMVKSGARPLEVLGLTAYVVVGALADHLLRLHLNVIVDAVNDAPEARQQWLELAGWHDLEPLYVEVVCSDPTAHRRRLEARESRSGKEATRWSDLEPRRRLLTGWLDDRLVVDSCVEHARNVDSVVAHLEGMRRHATD